MYKTESQTHNAISLMLVYTSIKSYDYLIIYFISAIFNFRQVSDEHSPSNNNNNSLLVTVKCSDHKFITKQQSAIQNNTVKLDTNKAGTSSLPPEVSCRSIHVYCKTL